MKLLYLILYLIYSNFHFSITQTFNFLNESCLGSFSNRTKMGEVFVYTYHPKIDTKTIIFNEHHTVHFPPSNKIATLILVIKNENIQLAKVIYSDLNNDNIIDDLFYQKEYDEWNRIDEENFDDVFKRLSNKLKTFNVNKISENWYNCVEGLSDQKLCTIKNNYFVNKIIMGNSLIWENEFYYTVYAIGMSLKEENNNNKLSLKLYCTIDGRNHIIEFEVELVQTHVFLTKKAWGIPNNHQNHIKPFLVQQRNGTNKDHHPSRSQTRVAVTPLDSEAAKNRLKGIDLETEPLEINGEHYKTRSELMLELNTVVFEPLPGVKVKLLKDNETILWDSDDLTKTFSDARFFFVGEGPILLRIKYTTKGSSWGISKTYKHNHYLIKSNGWHTLTEQKFNEELSTLSDAVTLYQLDNGSSIHQCSVDTDGSNTEISNLTQTRVTNEDEEHRLKNITLDLVPSEAGSQRVNRYLMDGLDTSYYEPTNGALVKYVKDNDKTIWNYDDGKRTLIYAKFCYKKDSQIFLSVFYLTNIKNKEVKTFDYFIKRDKWYHSKEDEFNKLLDLLINKVTFRARVINEKVSFEDHVKNLDVSIKGKKPNWIEENIFRRKQPVKKLQPFEYDINEEDKEKFIIEININEKFGIYTPKTGLALSRIKDKDRVIWFQEANGSGCTTLYMDLSGKNPLIHLILDDPLDSDMYYKKIDGNWHVIDEDEYEKIRKKSETPPTQSSFTRIDNTGQN